MVVNPPSDQQAGSEPVQTQEQTPTSSGEVVATATQPGDKTDSALLLESLQEERRKRRELEEQLLKVTSPAPSEEEIYSDEGKVLKGQISTLEAKLAQLEDEKELSKVYSVFPDVKDMASEFEEFRKDYPRHKLENVAKLFRVEKGLAEPVRKGLEKPTGGPKAAPSNGTLTADEAATLRSTNFKEYQRRLMNGEIKIA